MITYVYMYIWVYQLLETNGFIMCMLICMCVYSSVLIFKQVLLVLDYIKSSAHVLEGTLEAKLPATQTN